MKFKINEHFFIELLFHNQQVIVFTITRIHIHSLQVDVILMIDTLLSKMNKQKGAEGESMVARLAQFSRQLGIRGLFLGLGARVIMVRQKEKYQILF